MSVARLSLLAVLLLAVALLLLRGSDLSPGALFGWGLQAAPRPSEQPPSHPEPSVDSTSPAGVAPSDPSAAVARARQCLRNGDAPAAVDAYSEATSTGGGSPETWLEMGSAQVAAGDAAGAVESLRRLLATDPPEPLEGRARLLEGSAELLLGRWEDALGSLSFETVPDGLDDLAELYRAEALAGLGQDDAARGELRRREVRESTNRLLLGRAAALAERLGDYDLAGELYARGAGYFGWTAERLPMYTSAASAFVRAGDEDRAVDQYQTLVEQFGWTPAGQDAGAELWRMGRLDAYHGGLAAVYATGLDAARAGLQQAVDEGGQYAEAAASRLRQIDEAVAWQSALQDDTPEAYQDFRDRFPAAQQVAESWFREGLDHYLSDEFSEALGVWEQGASQAAGDGRARFLLWQGKALAQLGRDDEARGRLQEAADSRPAGYYTLRARDLLSGTEGWPRGDEPGPLSETEVAAADQWVDGWAAAAGSGDAREEERARRGFGLLALGMRNEATAEFDGLIAESHDASFLVRLAEELARQQLWNPSSRAASRVVSLSPEKSVADAPKGIQRLAYPYAYPDLVRSEAGQRGLDPLLFLSLVRQESIYDPAAVSLADARGLTQVMPSTARGIAGALGRSDFDDDDLYRPALAVEFGTWYLAQQLAGFGGDPFQALAAYNAGAASVSRWASSDPDLFVELIDYSETRDYIRQVYFHYSIYRSLGGKGQ